MSGLWAYVQVFLQLGDHDEANRVAWQATEGVWDELFDYYATLSRTDIYRGDLPEGWGYYDAEHRMLVVSTTLAPFLINHHFCALSAIMRVYGTGMFDVAGTLAALAIEEP